MRFRTITTHIAGDIRKYTAEPPIRDHSKFEDLVFGYENPPFGMSSEKRSGHIFSMEAREDKVL